MYNFHSDEYFSIKLRGKPYIGFVLDGNDLPEGMWNPSDLTKQIIHIEYANQHYEKEVKAVESFRHMISPEHPYRKRFTVLFDEWDGALGCPRGISGSALLETTYGGQIS